MGDAGEAAKECQPELELLEDKVAASVEVVERYSVF